MPPDARAATVAGPARVVVAARRPPRLGRFAFGIAVTAIYVFLLAPVAIIVFSSFNPTEANTFPPGGFSLRWYGKFLESERFVGSFRFSLWLAVVAAVAATLIGFVTAYGLVRGWQRGRGLVQSLAMLPMMVPHLLISISLLLALLIVPVPELAVLIVGHVLICLPFTIACIVASLEGIDAQLELAALTLGASRARALWEVVIPLVAPGLLSALLFAFMVSFGDVYIALFLSGPGRTTLPIEVFAYMQWESTPVVAAITTVQILLIIGLGLVIERLVGLRKIMRV
ncbi:MAG TPA: ABC transporter permease [Candidatus Methylomirabilis sp.]|nr:ABC transporter permease [Candidatus Methylomirabilis sp.]